MRVAISIAIVTLATGCFDPFDPPELGCSESGECPPGQSCGRGVCWLEDDIRAGSGLDRSKFPRELTRDEIRTFCEWSVAAQGGPGRVLCVDEDGEWETTVSTVEECIAEGADEIPCSLGLVEDCILSLEFDPCRVVETQECAALLECLTRAGNAASGVALPR